MITKLLQHFITVMQHVGTVTALAGIHSSTDREAMTGHEMYTRDNMCTVCACSVTKYHVTTVFHSNTL